MKRKKDVYNLHFISRLRLYPPKTGGLKYNYEIYKHILDSGFNITLYSWENIPEFIIYRLSDPLFYLEHLLFTPNPTILIQDSAPGNSYILHTVIFRLLTNIKIVTIFHHSMRFEKRPTFFKILGWFIEPLFLKLSHIVITNSEYTKNQAVEMGVDKNKIFVIHPAINLPLKKFNERKKLNQPPVLFFLGYVSHRKGLIFLLEALNMIRDRDWRLIVAGDTSQDPEYVERCYDFIKKYGLEEKIEFTGMIAREKINEHFSNSDIFIFPTLYEGYGMVIKEAASSGIPIISTNISNIPYIVKDQVSALLVPPEDPEALKDAIIKLLEDKKLRKKISIGAYKTVDFSYNWKKAGEKFLSIILGKYKS